MSDRKKKALIIGCGLAGPALAVFLQRAGIEAEIYETRTTPEGYALSLASNGVRVLKLLGVAEAAEAFASPIADSVMWNGKGRRLAAMPLAGLGEKSLFLKRVEFGQLLSDLAERQGIPIARGKKLQNIEQTGGEGVVATFQDGTQASGDLLIGCDGVHSRTRQLIDPAFPGATYTGLMNTGGYTQGVKFNPTPGRFHFVFGKRAFFGYHVYDSGEGCWFVNYTQAEEPAKGATLGAASAEWRRHLLDLFPGELPIIHQMIEATQVIFPDFPTYILPKPPLWHKGSVALIADAAHAISSSSGQGASMALEDALIMAKCLRDIPETEQAFATFEHLRRERVAKMLELGIRGDQGKFSKGPMQIWMRDMMTSFFLTLFANPKSLDWIYSYPLEWDTGIDRQGPVMLKQHDGVFVTAR